MPRLLAALIFLLGGCAAPSARQQASLSAGNRDRSASVRAHSAFHHEFSNYLHRVIKQVDREWNRGIRDRLRQRIGAPAAGTKVEVTFTIDRTGRVSIGKVEGDAAQLWKMIAVDAIAATARTHDGYGAWTDEMVAKLGDRQELVFTFFY
jgi:hypothetical protein